MTGDPRLFDFEPVSRAQWVERAAKDLSGRGLASLRTHSLDGVEIEALYTFEQVRELPALDSMPGAHPFVRGRTVLGAGPEAWETRQEYTQANPADAAAAALHDLQLGAHSLHIILAPSLRRAVGDAAGPGVVLSRQPSMARLLRDLDLAATPIFFQVGVAGMPIAGMLQSVLGDATPGLRGGVLVDPIAELAEAGSLGVSLERALDDMSEVFGWCETRASGLAAIGVSAVPYHEAGASAVQEVGIALATGALYLRELEKRGHSPETVAPRMVFRFSVGRDLFLNVAKLRAARLGWAQICAACGLRSAQAAMRVHARGSSRTRTRTDPWVNLLRGTVESFAAVVGGADAVATTRLDDAFGASDPVADRMAINTQVLLREESHLGAVIDPAGGSYYVEALTHTIAGEAWSLLRELDGRGGIAAALVDGSVAAWISERAQEGGRAVASGRCPITGVSAFALLDDEPFPRPAAAELPASVRGAGTPADPTALAARLGALATAPVGFKTAALVEAVAAGAAVLEIIAALGDDAEPASAPALRPVRIAEPFEVLRDRADEFAHTYGRRPVVFLARMGPARVHKARADFCRNLLASGGIEVSEDSGFEDAAAAASALRRSGSRIAIICGADERYPELVPALVPALRAAGAHRVMLAGRPASQIEAHRSAGIDEFVHLGVDAPAFLEGILRDEGAFA